jgi:hypothetical protein
MEEAMGWGGVQQTIDRQRTKTSMDEWQIPNNLMAHIT